MKNSLMKKNILGVGVTDASQADILEYIVTFIEETAKKMYVVTPNPEILMFANTHPDFKNILNNAEISLADGVGVLWAGNVLGKSLKNRVAGTDLLEKLCKAVSKKPITVGFLGGKGQVAEETAECLKKRYPGLKVSFAKSELASEISLPPTDILFVAFGFPKQEKFMADNLQKLPVRVMIGVGGAFDYISGRVPRAPAPVRNVGFEWLFRLLVQPWRFKRQTALIRFVGLVLKERFK